MSVTINLKSPGAILNQGPNTWPTPREKQHLSSLVSDIETLANNEQNILTSNLTIPTPNAINSTGTATVVQMLGGVITSTSAAATSITTPTATAILAAIQGGAVGTAFNLVVDNSQGANTITIVLDGSITAPVGAITGGNTLTVTTTHKVGIFKIYFTSPTTAVIFRTS